MSVRQFPWLRLYCEIVDDIKVQSLSLAVFRTWINLLCVARQSKGVIPGVNAVAFRLRMSTHDAARHIDDLILAGLIDIMPNGDHVPHKWDVRQYDSDSSVERTRKYRENKKKSAMGSHRDGDGDVTVTANVTKSDAIDQIRTESESESVPSTEQGSAREAREQILDSDSGGEGGKPGSGLRKGGQRPLDLDRLKTRAEGFGLDVEGVLETLERNRPRNPSGYFLTLCVNQLRARVPTASDELLRAALKGETEAVKVIFQALTNQGVR